MSNKNVNRVFLITVAVYLGVSLLLGYVVTVPMPMNAGLILSQALVLLPSLIYCGIRRIPLGEVVPFRKMKFSVWILVVVCTYLMYPLLIVLNALTLFFVDSGTADLMGIATQNHFLIATLLMAGLPAFVEEFVFRGMLFSTYKKSRMLPAVFLSAFLFGCMHLNFNQFLYAFALGIYLAFLVEATGSILSSMLAHFTINFTSVLMTYALPKLMEAAGGGMETQLPSASGRFLSTMDEGSLFIMIIGVVFWAAIALGTTAGGIGVYIAISKISGRWEHVKTMFRQGTREHLLSISVVIAAVLAIVFMVVSII
ncbi:MAG: CPBP family intramembrane metalloprotease [Lachnospiraceae bacterium]|nr:CPBP family intramembrane metalloprotease [Lachnospiraceae bacterium]